MRMQIIILYFKIIINDNEQTVKQCIKIGDSYFDDYANNCGIKDIKKIIEEIKKWLQEVRHMLY